MEWSVVTLMVKEESITIGSGGNLYEMSNNLLFADR